MPAQEACRELASGVRLMIEALPGCPSADSLVQEDLHGRGCGGWLLDHTHARYAITKASFTDAGPTREERLGSRLEFDHGPIKSALPVPERSQFAEASFWPATRAPACTPPQPTPPPAQDSRAARPVGAPQRPADGVAEDPQAPNELPLPAKLDQTAQPELL